MSTYLSDSFISSSLNFLILALVLSFLFHIPIFFGLNLSKLAWKKVNYLFLAFSITGLVSVAINLRSEIANNWAEIEKSRAQSFADIELPQLDPSKNSYYCMELKRSENSAENYSKIEKDFKNACSWLKITYQNLSKVDYEEPSKINVDALPPINFTEASLTDLPNWIRKRVSEYNEQVDIYRNTKKLTQKSPYEAAILYYAPFLLCISFAIGITKTTGELRIEKEELRRRNYPKKANISCD